METGQCWHTFTSHLLRGNLEQNAVWNQDCVQYECHEIQKTSWCCGTMRGGKCERSLFHSLQSSVQHFQVCRVYQPWPYPPKLQVNEYLSFIFFGSNGPGSRRYMLFLRVAENPDKNCSWCRREMWYTLSKTRTCWCQMNHPLRAARYRGSRERVFNIPEPWNRQFGPNSRSFATNYVPYVHVDHWQKLVPGLRYSRLGIQLTAENWKGPSLPHKIFPKIQRMLHREVTWDRKTSKYGKRPILGLEQKIITLLRWFICEFLKSEYKDLYPLYCSILDLNSFVMLENESPFHWMRGKCSICGELETKPWGSVCLAAAQTRISFNWW